MKIIQSFWSGGKKSLLKDDFGWLTPEYHVMGWCLSSNLLSELYNVELYTDKVGYDFLIEKLQLPYSKVHIVLDDLNEYNKNLWALSKIYTYSLQNEPFLHVDGDVFIWEKFSDELISGNLIAQNLESATDYYEKIMTELEEELNYFPKEILLDRKEDKLIKAYNAGIFGGHNIDFFKDYTAKSFKFVDKNINNLNNINVTNFNIFFEQYLFYCLSKGIKVNCYFDEVFEDNGYKGFGNFEDVPYDKTFLHLLGVYKRDPYTCKKMSQNLLIEYPNEYTKVLKLFKKKIFYFYPPTIYELNCTSLNYNYINSETKKTSQECFANFFNQTPLKDRYSKTYNLLSKFLKFDSNRIELSFNSIKVLRSDIKLINNQSVRDVFEYEESINEYLESLNNYNLKSLINRDLMFRKNYKNFLSKTKVIKLAKEKNSTYLSSPFLITDNNFLYNPEDKSNKCNKLIIPDVEVPFYYEIVLDELDEIIINELNEVKTIKNLSISLEKYFDKEDLESSKLEFEKLLYSKLKRLIYQKGIRIF